MGWSIGHQPRPQPVQHTRQQTHSRRQVVLAARIVAHADGQAALAGTVQEALDLGFEVELVAAAVCDVHLKLAWADIVGIEHFDGIVLTNEGGRLGVAPAVEGIYHAAGPDGDDQVEPSNHLVAVAEILAPSPATRVEAASVAAMTVFPA